MLLFFSNKYIVTIFRIVFALIFLFAGMEKVAAPDEFAVSISNYKVLPYFSVNFFAVVLAWIEVIAAILLLFNAYVKENSLLLNSMLVLFTVMVAFAVLRGLDIDCGCFGTKYGQQVGMLKITENLATIFIGYIVYKFSDNSISLIEDN